ncbi:MAG: TetR/AcrR family transcriptional regulator [Alphaproteobacteria bacterium]|nr:TetR/AcrR family transcriptional regulator [Alphaproteobacteria bacterium]
MPNEHLDEIATQILDAASCRFLHYGYGKTTMSEIAKDCNMSTGNLYRYFPSKLDIAEMFVRVLRREQVVKLRTVLEASDSSPSEMLREFFLLKFKISYDRFHDKPKAFELSSELLSQRPKVALEWKSAEGRVLEEILRLGAADGSFAVDDVALTTKVLQDTSYRFTSPAVFHEGEFDELVIELSGVIDLALDALSYRAARKMATETRQMGA